MDEYLLLQPRQIKGFSFRKRWQTSILTSIDGSEQRSALLTWPKRTLTFTPIGINPAQLNYIKRNLFKNLPLSWGIPFWQDRTTLTSQANEGNTILNVGSILYRNFEIGASCILVRMINYLPYSEERVIKSFPSNTQIELTEGLGTTWIIGTEVYPLLKSKLDGEQLIDALDLNIGDVAIEAREDFEDYDDGVTKYTPHTPNVDFFQPPYKGFLVFPFKPKQGTLRVGLYHPYEHLAFLGESYSETVWDETTHRLRADFVVTGRDRIHIYSDFFDYQRGRHGNFWLPTGQKDVVVTEVFLSTDNHLHIEPIDYENYWYGSETARHIVLRWPDGTLICKKVTSYTVNTLTIEGTIGKDSPSDLSKLVVSFLLMVRFDIDEIEINYLLEELSLMSLSFYSLPKETPA